MSRDGGRTWQAAGSPPVHVLDIAASAVNAAMVYAATRNGMMFNSDAGKLGNRQGPTPLILAMLLMLTAAYVWLAHVEERQTLAEFGEQYRSYMKRVPAVVPW